MAGLYPLMFTPTFKKRVWGGRSLERLYGKALPPDVSIGESWEVSDRDGDESVVANGPLAGRTLRWLMKEHARELMGAGDYEGRFPILCKILDAREKLSLQVHPPANVAAALGGEPKTEMWYVAHAAPGADLYVGLKRGVGRAEFERALASGQADDCVHRIPVETGDVMFLPSGRVHAIGAGLVIFEIQQNSDTTYRVFDWNRVGLDGKPRELHVPQSLASINFDDVEPALAEADSSLDGDWSVRPLVRHPLFNVDAVKSPSAGTRMTATSRPQILAVVAGDLTVSGGGIDLRLRAGDFAIVPASVTDAGYACGAGTSFLLVEPGPASQHAPIGS